VGIQFKERQDRTEEDEKQTVKGVLQNRESSVRSSLRFEGAVQRHIEFQLSGSKFELD
jgi:hypothetical protein